MDRQHVHDQAATTAMPSSVGIEVSKARLDVAVRPSGDAWQSGNDERASPRWWAACSRWPRS